MLKAGKMLRVAAAVALGGALVAALSGCTRVELPAGERFHIGDGVRIGDADDMHAEQSFKLPRSSDSAEVSLEMGVGSLYVEGGARKGELATGEFEWSSAGLRPRFSEESVGESSRLRIRHGEAGFSFPDFLDDVESSWDIALTKEVPIDLNVDLGVGEATLVLGELHLSDLRVDMGVGDCEIDLVGDVEESFDANINAGVGSLTLVLPEDVGVRVSGRSDGIGNYSADGFTVDGDSFVNAAWGVSDVEIDIELSRGVGDVRLRMQD